MHGEEEPMYCQTSLLLALLYTQSKLLSTACFSQPTWLNEGESLQDCSLLCATVYHCAVDLYLVLLSLVMLTETNFKPIKLCSQRNWKQLNQIIFLLILFTVLYIKTVSGLPSHPLSEKEKYSNQCAAKCPDFSFLIYQETTNHVHGRHSIYPNLIFAFIMPEQRIHVNKYYLAFIECYF